MLLWPLLGGITVWVMAFSRRTSPVAVLGATVPLIVMLTSTANVVPERFSVVVEAVRLGETQAASKFATFTLPSPVAKSYPVDVLNAGVVPLAITPNWFADLLVLLQFALPPTQATETFPFVMS